MLPTPEINLSIYSCHKTWTVTCNRSRIYLIAKRRKGTFGTNPSSPICFNSVFVSWLSLWFLHKVIQRKTLAPLVVLGKKLEFYSWVSSISILKPICESPVFRVRIFQHRSVIIFCYFCAEQMAMVVLKELRHSQFFYCWVLLINSKDQNVTFNGC